MVTDDPLRFSSGNEAIQFLSNLLQKRVKIAKEMPYNGNADFVRSTVTKFEESDSWETKQQSLDRLFVDRFGMTKKFDVDRYSFGVEKMVIGLLDELSKCWSIFESSSKDESILDLVLKNLYAIGNKLGYFKGIAPMSLSSLSGYENKENN